MRTEQEVLALNNARESLDYCFYRKDANVKLHEDIIVNNKNAFCAYHFAKDIAGANIERLQEVVINYGKPYDIYWFAKRVENSNKEELFKAMLKTNKENWIHEFIKTVELPEELKELTIFI